MINISAVEHIHKMLMLLSSQIYPAVVYAMQVKRPTLRHHYENVPMQHTDFFSYFCSNIDRGYALEPPHQGGSNEYPQFMFWIKNKKNRFNPANPSFYCTKVGFKGIYISRIRFPDVAGVHGCYLLYNRFVLQGYKIATQCLQPCFNNKMLNLTLTFMIMNHSSHAINISL